MHLDMLTADHHHHSSSRLPHTAADGSCKAGALQMPLSLLGSLLRQQSLTPIKDDHAEVSTDGSDDTTISSPKTNHPMKTDSGVHNSPAPSRRTSFTSDTSTERPKKRNTRPKTVYKLAQPHHPRGKLHLRPKVVLQLHQVVASRRPKPAYEVLPYSILTSLSGCCKARTYRGRSLTASDLLVLKAEEYQHNEEEKSDEERYGSREVVGVIRPGKEDKSGSTKTEIVMENGQSWEVSRTPNGGYEFSCVDDHGLALTSRWVVKPPHLRRQSSMSNTSQPSPTEGRKFTFSTISQNSRRHPIVATMTRDGIEVSDSYMMPSVTSPPTPNAPGSPLPTPVATPASIDMDSFLDTDRLPIETSDALKSFILVSGVWVAFQENWSAAYSVYAKGAAPLPLATSNTARVAPNRTVSMTYLDTPRSASPVSDENKRIIPRIVRTHTQFLHSKTSEPASPSSPIKTRPRRSNSTGNTDLFRNGSLRKRFGFALENQAVPETEEDRQSNRSVELLRVKELTLSPPPTLSTGSGPLSPIPSIEPPTSPTDSDSSSPQPNPRTRKTRSAYDPVPTAGMWDSGVIEGKGTLKTRPTSLVVMNDKMKKAKRKEERSKSRDKSKGKKEKKQKEGRRKSEGLRNLFTGFFRKEKHSV